MKRRALLASLLTGLGASAAMAQTATPAAPRPNTAPQRSTPEERRRRRQAEKTATATTPEPPGQPAPIPNRDIEAPVRLNEPPRASLSPTLIHPEPAQPHLGRSGFAVQVQEDRLIRQPAPGARLNVPF